MISPNTIALSLVVTLAAASTVPQNNLFSRQDCNGPMFTCNGNAICCPGSIWGNVCCVGDSSTSINEASCSGSVNTGGDSFGGNGGHSGCPSGLPQVPLTASDFSSLVAQATATAGSSAAATTTTTTTASITSAPSATSTGSSKASSGDTVIVNGSVPTSTSTGGSPAITGNMQWAVAAIGGGALLLV